MRNNTQEKIMTTPGENDVDVSIINTSTHPQYMGHEAIYRISSPSFGVTAFVGVHNTALGPGLGGMRYKAYSNENEAIGDVLRLSEAMTWKNAAGGLEFGGGKTVVMAIEGQRIPNETTLDVMSIGLNKINADKPVYFGAEDMNFGESALNYMAEQTQWINGATAPSPDIVGGSPSPQTAIGVFECMKVVAKFKLDKGTLQGVRVSMQGLGAVGLSLAKMLSKEGAILIATDVAHEPFEILESEGIPFEKVGLNDIYDVEADIFAPNAIGGTLTEENVRRLHTAGVSIVCGAANNQQEDQIENTQSKLMHQLGMLYCPDYIVNAGGVIWVAKVGKNAQEEIEAIRTGVPKRFQEVLDMSVQSPDTDLATLAAQYSRARVEKVSK